MSDVTYILSQIEAGAPRAAEQLLPLVYDELRKLAAAKLAQEKVGHTLQPTALVHEAYLRLVKGLECVSTLAASELGAEEPNEPRRFADSRHFFLAAAEAMRRILVESARRKNSLKRGGGRQRVDLFDSQLSSAAPDERIVALDEALSAFALEQPRMSELVKLHFFAGLTLEQAAASLDISLRTAKRDWTFARAWLRRKMDSDE